MRWQPGGNLEPVRIICETNWRQCTRAILRYVWTEIVTDVVDCLTTESTLWRIIAVCLVCVTLLRTFYYVKRKWSLNGPAPSGKYILSRVGCKVDDLELKINILTYKLQYGTWPLPHQIPNSALKKLHRDLRLTLSTSSSDRKDWIRRILLGSTSNAYLSSPTTKLDPVSVHRTNELSFDPKTEYLSFENQRPDVSLATDQSDVDKSWRTNSVESTKKTNPEGVDRRRTSKSENLKEESRCNVTGQLSLLQPIKENGDDHYYYSLKKIRKQKRPRLSNPSRSKITGCDEYTGSIADCKGFLKDLKESNRKLFELDCSSSVITNESSTSLRDSWTDEKSSLHAQTTDARNTSGRRCEIIGEANGTLVKVEREKWDPPNTYTDIISNGIQIDRIKSNDNGQLSSLNSSIHCDTTSNGLMIDEPTGSIIPSQNDNDVIEMSQIRLHRIKRKLESLDDVLRAYSTLDSCVTWNNVERSKEKGNDDDDIETIYRNVVETLDALKLEIRNINETKRNDVTFEPNKAKRYDDKMLQTNSSDYELYESIDDSEKSCSISMKSYSERSNDDDPLDSTLAAGNNRRGEERSIEIDATYDLSRSNRVLITDRESVNLSNDTQTRKKKESSDVPVTLKIDEVPSILISANSSKFETISKDGSDLENDSTEMLIREALQCKKELLSRVKLHEFRPSVEVRRNEGEEITDDYYEEDVNNDEAWLETDKCFQSKLLDIIAEESTSSCTDKTSGTYIYLQMKQQSIEMSDGSSSSSPDTEEEEEEEKEEMDDKKREKNVNDENIPSEMCPSREKEALLPVAVSSSRYFSFNDLTSLPKYDQNIIPQELPPDSDASLRGKNESIKSANSLLQCKRRYGEVARWDDEEGRIGDDRKRRCHRDEEEKIRSISSSCGRLRRAKSVPKASRKGGRTNDVRRNVNDVTTRTTGNANCVEFLQDLRKNGNDIFRENENDGILSVGTDDLLSWNRTTDSSSVGSVKYRFTIDNGSMTNFFSSTDSNLEICNRYPSMNEIDERNLYYGQDLSLRRRPGILSFGQLKMNGSILPDENEIFKNPYFLGEKTTPLSNLKRGETIELNLIPISVSIESHHHESNIIALTHGKIFDDPNNVSSPTLRISYNDDLESGDNDVTEIIEMEDVPIDKKETSQVTIPDNNRRGILCVSDRSTNFVNRKKDERKSVRRKRVFVNETIQSNTTRSRSNVIARKSSSYVTGDTSSSTGKIDFESCRLSESNIRTNSFFKEIDIKNDILESCIDSCIDLLRKRKMDDNNGSLRSTDLTSVESTSNNDNDASNKTSVSYIEANDFQSSHEIAPREESNAKRLKNKSEGFIFDGSIKYKKPQAPVDEQNSRKHSRPINSNWSKSIRTTSVDERSKDTTNSKRNATTNNNTRLKMKTISSINGDKDTKKAPNSARSHNYHYVRSNSCNLSQDRSRSYGGTNKNDLSSRSAVFPHSDDRRSTKEEATNKGKAKFVVKTETHVNRQTPSTPKSFSKSCIPILKSRLDARRTEQHMCRPKSPTRGPLTMTGLCRDRMDNNDEKNVSLVDVIPTEGSSINKEESQKHLDNGKTFEARFKTYSSQENTNVIDENCSGNKVPRERTIIYVNIINHSDYNVTRIMDPDKFLEYTSNVETIEQNVNEPDAKLRDNDNVPPPPPSSSSVIMAQEKNTLPKLVTIVSSVANEADNNDENYSNGSSLNRNVSAPSAAGTLKNFWSVTIQQKEMEVSVKPSVADTSTSMSDLFKITGTMMPLHEHQIFHTPKELTNEEYSYLFEILTRKQNLGHLKEIRNLCNRLRLRRTNLE